MDLALNDEQIELQRAARRFATELASGSGPLDDRAWADVTQLGWVGMAIPERHGGSGASWMDVAVVFEELGRVAGSSLLFDNAVLAPAVLHTLGTPWARQALTELTRGERRIAVLVDDEIGLPADRGTNLAVDAASGSVTGDATAVRDASSVTHFLVLGRSGGAAACALVDAASGATITPLDGFVPDYFGLELDGVVAEELARIPSLDDLRAAVLATVPVLCAYQVGSCQTAFELSVAYSRERVQFGKPIGTFQRVQDHVIDLINATDSSPWVTNYAVWSVESSDDFAMAVHVAKSVTAQAHVAACSSAHEVHAGIGADLQYGLARHTFASRALYSRLGDPAWHQRCVARRLRQDAVGMTSGGR